MTDPNEPGSPWPGGPYPPRHTPGGSQPLDPGPGHPVYPPGPLPGTPPVPPPWSPGRTTPTGYPGYGPPPGLPPHLPPGLRPQPPSSTSRLHRRPEPRLGVALAGVGVAVALVGVLLWGGDYVIEGVASGADPFGGGSDSRKLLGAGLAFVVAAIGYLLVVRAKHGPLAAAGVAGSALGVPVMLAFLTMDLSGGSPISPDAVALVSIGLWLASYLWLPGARGHSFYLGLAALYLWGYLLSKVVSTTSIVSPVVSRLSPFDSAASAPNWGNVAGLSLLFGLGYYALALWLDTSGRRGVAPPLLVAAFVATGVGLGTLGAQLHSATPIGLLLVLLGAALAAYGARYGHRFTTWTWAGAAGAGLVVIVADQLDPHSIATGGFVLVLLGLALVWAARTLSRVSGEPDELTPRADIPLP